MNQSSIPRFGGQKKDRSSISNLAFALLVQVPCTVQIGLEGKRKIDPAFRIWRCTTMIAVERNVEVQTRQLPPIWHLHHDTCAKKK